MAHWREKAKCLGSEDPRWIDPLLVRGPQGFDQDEWRETVAQGMCSGCPVITECRREILDSHDIDQIKGGHYLSSVDWKSSRTHNIIRVELGLPQQLTRMDELVKTWPRPCTGGCGYGVRINPMQLRDFPGTRLGYIDSGLCLVCNMTTKEEVPQ